MAGLGTYFKGATSISKEFEDLILNDLLPTFCNDASRRWAIEGFQVDFSKIDPIDAQDFVRGMDATLVAHVGRGLYRAHRSHASEQFFWSGLKSMNPRPITLWVEPIITVAVLARLHFDFGWPENLIGTQSKNWEFDVTTYQSGDDANEYIACEIKKTVVELDQLIALMKFYGGDPDLDKPAPGKHLNAYRKVGGLQARQAPLFWAVGPGDINHLFQVAYGERGQVGFEETSREELRYKDS